MKKHLFQLVAVLVVACAWLWFRSSFSQPETNRNELIIDAEYQRGKQAVLDSRFAEAVQRLTNVIDADPDHPHARFQRGMAFVLQGENDKAFEDFTCDIELQPERAASYNNRSIILKARGDLEESLSDSNRAIDLAPHKVEFYHNRADTYFKAGRPQNGLVDLYVALELDDKNPITHHMLAHFYAMCPDERYRDPSDAIKHAIDACENSGWKIGFMLSTLAVAHAADDQFSEAIEYETQARRLYSPTEMQKSDERLRVFEKGEKILDRSIIIKEDDPGPMEIELPVIPSGLKA